MPKQFDFSAILQSYAQLQKQANAANDSRYQAILKTQGQSNNMVRGLYGQANSLLNNLGASEKQDIETGRQKSIGTQEQDLISRGLGNSTIRSSAMRGINTDATREQTRLENQVAQQRSGLLTQQAGAEQQMGNFLSDMMERRTDQGPDMGLYTNLLAQAAQSQAANAQSTNLRQNPPVTSLSDSLRGSSGGGGGTGTVDPGRFSTGGGGTGINPGVISIGGNGSINPGLFNNYAGNAADRLSAALGGVFAGGSMISPASGGAGGSGGGTGAGIDLAAGLQDPQLEQPTANTGGMNQAQSLMNSLGIEKKPIGDQPGQQFWVNVAKRQIYGAPQPGAQGPMSREAAMSAINAGSAQSGLTAY